MGLPVQCCPLLNIGISKRMPILGPNARLPTFPQTFMPLTEYVLVWSTFTLRFELKN